MSQSTTRILVLEDEALMQECMQLLLEELGFEVEIADDGRKIVDLYRSASECDRPYRAVILDLNVPGGQSGGEAMRQLLEFDRSVFAIASSGDPHHPIMVNPAARGFKATLAKPFEICEVEQALSGVMSPC